MKTRKECKKLKIIPTNDILTSTTTQQEQDINSLQSKTNLQISIKEVNNKEQEIKEIKSLEPEINLQKSIKEANNKDRYNKDKYNKKNHLSPPKKSNSFKKFLSKYSLSQYEIDQLKKQRDYYDKIDKIKLSIEKIDYQY